MQQGILLYDYLVARGGAEKLSLSIVNGIENTDFCVAVSDKTMFDANNLIAGGGSLHVLNDTQGTRLPYSLKAIAAFLFGRVFTKHYQWCIYSGSYAPLAALLDSNRVEKQILYCHALPRGAYDLYDYRLSKMSGINALLFKVYCALIRLSYRRAVGKMDLVIANSENVKRRIKKYLGLDAVVINPPIDVNRFQWISQDDYYLSMARLEPEKRVDVIVQAFMKMPEKRLVVASGGSQLEALREMALGHSNITFLGWTSDEELMHAVGNCLATIYIPMDEDFGMSPLESMSAGKPVVGVAEGGMLETVIDGKNGFFLEQVNAEALAALISSLEATALLELRHDCEEHAQKFREDVFIARVKSAIDSVL